MTEEDPILPLDNFSKLVPPTEVITALDPVQTPVEEATAVELPTAASLVAGEILPTPSKDTAADIVDRWFAGCFPSSVIAQSTESWNFVSNAKEELKKLLS